jgi:hypothetical protein
MADATIDPAAQSDDVKYWLEQIEGAQGWRQDWYERGQKVVDRYLDKRDVVNSTASHKMNTLWSNVQTTMPALYAKTPNPKVTRRFRDKDGRPLGRYRSGTLPRYASTNTMWTTTSVTPSLTTCSPASDLGELRSRHWQGSDGQGSSQ